MQDAACFTEVWATAYQLLFFIVKAQPGETVLVHAAASGVGTALIQLAQLRGIKTIAVSSSAEKLEVCSKFKATATVNYKTNPNWEQEVLALTEGKGVNVVLDPVGAQNAAKNAICCA